MVGKVFHVNGPQGQGGIAIKSDKTDFKPKLVRRDKESHFIQIKTQSIKTR
jgi:hypothetical protein